MGPVDVDGWEEVGAAWWEELAGMGAELEKRQRRLQQGSWWGEEEDQKTWI